MKEWVDDMKMNHIDETAIVGADCVVGNFASIEAGCVLGDRVIIHNNVTIYPGTQIGDNTEIFDGAVIGRPPKSSGNTVHKLAAKFEPVQIGSGCVIGANTVIYAQCRLGDGVLVGDGAKIREGNVLSDHALIAMNCTINHDSMICERAKVMDLAHITANTVIGRSVFVGPCVCSANDNAMRISGTEVGATTQIEIGEGSRIGSAAMILPNIKIGEGALVGACALVTHNVPDGVRVMGIPAREK